MKLSVALFFAGIFGALAAVFILLSFGTDYWLLASESCHRNSSGLAELGGVALEVGVKVFNRADSLRRLEKMVLSYFNVLGKNNVKSHFKPRGARNEKQSVSFCFGPCGWWQQRPPQWLDWRAGRHPCRSSPCNQTLFNVLRASVCKCAAMQQPSRHNLSLYPCDRNTNTSSPTGMDLY